MFGDIVVKMVKLFNSFFVLPKDFFEIRRQEDERNGAWEIEKFAVRQISPAEKKLIDFVNVMS